MVTAAQVIAAARGEIGYHEGRTTDGHWDNKEKYAAEVGLEWVDAGGYPWCAVFVCWAFNKVGALKLVPGGATASVAHLRDFGKQAKRFSEYPAVGAIALFGQNGDAHTGIVESYDATTVTTIEGNTNTDGSPEGDGVYRKVHQRTDTWVYGYVYPAYDGGIASADPAWRHAAPRPKGPQTRGRIVDAVLKLLRKAKGKGRRRRLLDSAESNLRAIGQHSKKKH